MIRIVTDSTCSLSNELVQKYKIKTATFKFTLPDGVTIEIEGKIIVSRPEDRIKKRFRKYW